MITKNLPFLFFISFIIILLSTCKKDQEEDSFYQQISSETMKWMSIYEAQDQEIIYVNASNDTARLVVSYTNNSGTPYYIDCTRNDEIVQCAFRSAYLDFPEEFDPTNKRMTLGIALIANHDVRIMPTSSSIVLSAGRFDDETKEVITESETHFQVSYSENYSYQGGSYEAVTINTITTENLATGGMVPPKRFVYAKEIGLVTWDDYDGVTWNLVQ